MARVAVGHRPKDFGRRLFGEVTDVNSAGPAVSTLQDGFGLYEGEAATIWRQACRQGVVVLALLLAQRRQTRECFLSRVEQAEIVATMQVNLAGKDARRVGLCLVVDRGGDQRPIAPLLSA